MSSGALFTQPDGPYTGPRSAAAAATTLFQCDMTGYGSVTVQVTSVATAATITYQTSMDGTNWVNVTGVALGTPLTLGTTSTATGMATFPKVGQYFRAQLTAYTGPGTVTIYVGLNRSAMVYPSLT